MLAENFVSFLSNDLSIAGAILGWPQDFIERIRTWNQTGTRDQAPPLEHRDELTHYGLIGPDGRLTPLGTDIYYHVSESVWQAGHKGLDGMLELGAIGPRVRVLDVGCGAAQTLRLLQPDRPVALAGVDVDVKALALGYQFARLEHVPVTLAATSAYTLPFETASFDLVVTRVALNYMHQRRALAEMVRMLRPGGFLFCRVERIWHDFGRIMRSPSPTALICRFRDLGYGAIHALSGLQPVPGSTLRGGRAFATGGRLRRILESLGCRVQSIVESHNCPAMLGHPTQLVVVAER